jgi:hypothetical protein
MGGEAEGAGDGWIGEEKREKEEQGGEGEGASFWQGKTEQEYVGSNFKFGNYKFGWARVKVAKICPPKRSSDWLVIFEGPALVPILFYSHQW